MAIVKIIQNVSNYNMTLSTEVWLTCLTDFFDYKLQNITTFMQMVLFNLRFLSKRAINTNTWINNSHETWNKYFYILKQKTPTLKKNSSE